MHVAATFAIEFGEVLAWMTARDLRTCIPVGELAAALGVDLDGLLEALASDEDGHTEIWDREGRLTITLTPWAAERAGLRTSDDGRTFEPIKSRRKARLKLSNQERLATVESDVLVDGAFGFDFDDQADAGAVDPAQTAEEGDRAGRISREPKTGAISDRLPPGSLMILVGLGQQWPIPAAAECPACRGVRFGRLYYCVCCDRSGVDDLLPKVARAQNEGNRRHAGRPAKGAKLQGGTGKADPRDGKSPEAEAGEKRGEFR